jgi:hypothetical protein
VLETRERTLWGSLLRSERSTRLKKQFLVVAGFNAIFTVWLDHGLIPLFFSFLFFFIRRRRFASLRA